MKNQKNQKRKISRFIKISLIIHIILILLFLLFAFKQTGIEKFKLIQLKKKKRDGVPAALKPRKSEFGTTVLFDDTAQFKASQETTRQKQSVQAYSTSTRTSGEKEKQKKPIQEKKKTQKVKPKKKKHKKKPKAKDQKKTKIKTTLDKDLTISSTEKIEQKKNDLKLTGTQTETKLAQAKTTKQKTTGKAKQDKSPIKKSIIGMTTGFIENLKQKGDAWLEREGDGNKNPSIEELKYISYEESIQWQLQQSRNINFNKSKFFGNNKVSRIIFVIDKKGDLNDIQLVESSGDESLDAEWVKIISLAAPFPPLPNHFKTEYYTTGRKCFYGSAAFGF